MKQIFITIIFLNALLSSCQCQTVNNGNEKKENFRWVGDIEQNESDNPDFKICNGEKYILQYFNTGKGPGYVGEKPILLESFKNTYKPVSGKNQNGFIRIRFVVNCKGKAGRFRTLQSDDDFEEFAFDEKIVKQLLQTTSEIENWEILTSKGAPVDYYFYLIFKIKDGDITEILP